MDTNSNSKHLPHCAKGNRLAWLRFLWNTNPCLFLTALLMRGKTKTMGLNLKSEDGTILMSWQFRKVRGTWQSVGKCHSSGQETTA